jgi:hypothetical protein
MESANTFEVYLQRRSMSGGRDTRLRHALVAGTHLTWTHITERNFQNNGCGKVVHSIYRRLLYGIGAEAIKCCVTHN